VAKRGTATVTVGELLANLEHAAGEARGQLCTAAAAKQLVDRWHQAGLRVAFTNGCFDLLHPGHVASLEAARKLGDCLVVGLNSDRSVRQLKGPGRPTIDQQGRAEMLAALACVDYVVIFDEASVAGLVDQVRPDVLAKSSEYPAEKIVGHEIVRRHGGHVVAVPMKPHYSTSELIQKIRGEGP
jgi:D-beta-D-heptose 7-phosphate kinase/D-beta-D-heptose 1-phosphate adenosyltransferase